MGKECRQCGGIAKVWIAARRGVSLEFVAIDSISLEQTRCERILHVGQQRCGRTTVLVCSVEQQETLQPPWKLRFLALRLPLLSTSPCPLDHLRESVTDGYRSGSLEEDPAIKDHTRCRSNRSPRRWDGLRRLKRTRLSLYPTWTLREICMLLSGRLPPPLPPCLSVRAK